MILLEDGFLHRQEILSLFAEYTSMLVCLDPSFSVYLDIQNYDEEIMDLESRYAPPWGRLYHLSADGHSAGCAALKRLDSGRCELKRLYVRPAFRGRGCARMLMDRILDDARAIGYSRILLDTLPELEAALSLYRMYGFTETGRYNDSPVGHTVFMELEL